MPLKLINKPNSRNNSISAAVPPQQCITRDNVAIEVDAVVYWQLLEHARAYYAVDNLQAAMVNLVLTHGVIDGDKYVVGRKEALNRRGKCNRFARCNTLTLVGKGEPSTAFNYNQQRIIR